MLGILRVKQGMLPKEMFFHKYACVLVELPNGNGNGKNWKLLNGKK